MLQEYVPDPPTAVSVCEKGSPRDAGDMTVGLVTVNGIFGVCGLGGFDGVGGVDEVEVGGVTNNADVVTETGVDCGDWPASLTALTLNV